MTHTEEVPTVAVSFDTILEIFELASPRLQWFSYPKYPLTFSCSPSGVWPTVRLGYIEEAEREYVTGRSPLLDLMASLVVLFHDARGARFNISMEGVTLTRTGDPICHFEVGA